MISSKMRRMRIERITNHLEESSMQIKAIERRYEAALSFAPESRIDRVSLWLDIGPDVGYGLGKLRSFNGKVLAIDLNEGHLRQAMGQNLHVDGVLMDGCQLGPGQKKSPKDMHLWNAPSGGLRTRVTIGGL